MNEPNSDNDPTGNDPENENALPEVSGNDSEPSAAENTNIQRIVELLPPEKRAELFGYIRQETTSHSGWLPTPGFMREYDELLPGLAERIVRMPEREQEFRHGTTANLIERDYRLRTSGQWMGMASLVLLLIFCSYLAYLGGMTAAASVAGMTIVGTVGIFVADQVTGKSGTTSKAVLDEPKEGDA